MNRIYRLCWNRSRAHWVPACELAKNAPPSPSQRHIIGRRAVMLSGLSLALGMTGLASAATTGGVITAGSGHISQSGTITTIEQNTPNLSLNWQSFNIASNETVNFLQPSASSIAVNRILGGTGSTILGHLNANGQVWLINPNGVLFGRGSQVSVAGLVASTLDTSDGASGSSVRSFSGNGRGSVVNQGTITAASGGYVALLGNQVSNQGIVSARNGTVALGAGSAQTLTFNGNQLVHLQVDQSTVNALAENRQLIQADGGQVIMTAGAKDALMASVVNNTGVIRAQTVENRNGSIILLGNGPASQVNVGGTLDASAPNGGNGGSIETSAANFTLASNALISAGASRGIAGTWLVDPVDLTIDAPAAATISNTLNGGTNVIEQTTASTASGVGNQSPGAGDINVNAAINWSNAAASLTLSAYHGITVKNAITGTGGLTMTAATGPININAAIRADTGVRINTSAGAINVGAAVNSGAAVAIHAIGGNLAIGSGGSITGGTGATLGTSANFTNAAGATAVTATTGNWLIYSTDPTLDTAGGLTPGFIQYNAPFGTAALGVNNGFLYSLAPTFRVTALSGSVSKVYDGTTVATLGPSNVSSTGLVNGNIVSSLTGAYATSNVGRAITVTSPASATALTITDATGLIPVYGYALDPTTVSARIGIITRAPLTASIVGDPSKVYNGTTTATLATANYSVTGFVAGQGATINQPSQIAYGTAEAGPGTISATFSSTNFIANSGTSFSNYTLPTSGSGPGIITQAPLRITGVIANGKIYDGTTGDPLNVSGANIFGVISQDSGAVVLEKTGGVGTFASPNVGTNVLVSLSGFSLSGTKANDYQLIGPTDLSADITPKALTISGLTATNKVYNANTIDNLNTASATLTGLVSADLSNVLLSSGGATGTFSQSDVGNNLAVSASGFSLSGTAASNYIINAVAGLSANITRAPLQIVFAGNPTKIYDGSNAATLTSSDFTVSGFVGGQAAVVSQSPATYASKNAATNVAVTASLEPSDFTPSSGTSLSNYSFPAMVSGPGTIDPAPLTGSITGNPTKVYDATTTANLGTGNFALSGFIPGENISVSSTAIDGAYASANAGVQAISATLGAGNFTAGAGTLLSNYVLPAAFAGFGTITQKALSASFSAAITGNPTRIYNGTTDATMTPADFTLSGFQGSDGAVVNHDISGQYGSKNVGSQPVSASLVETDFTGTGSTNLGNYKYPIQALGTGTITPAPLTVSIINNPTKTYDGSASAAVSSANFQIGGFVAGEAAQINPTTAFTYASPNAGTENITGSLTSGNYQPSSGTLMSNYTLDTLASGPGTITRAPLFITGVYGSNKVYDTGTGDILNVAAAALAGLVTTDAGSVDLTSSTAGTFAQANVGNGIAIQASGFSISGTAAANYLLQPLTGLTANITPAPLTLLGITAGNRIYNGSTIESLDSSAGMLSGTLGADVVTYSSAGATGQFRSANVGNNLAVTTSGYTLGGAAASNYTLSQPVGLMASITPAPLTAVISGSPNKVYDGSDAATLTAADYTLVGFVNGQGATVPQSATANYATPNAGTGLGIVSTLASSDFRANAGTNLSNYTLPTSGAGSNGVITPKILDLDGTRVYDAATGADASLFVTNGFLEGINGQTLSLSGSAMLVSKNVGDEGFSSFGSLALGSAGTGLASNYTLVGGNDNVLVTPYTLTVSNTQATSRVYNGSAIDALTGATLAPIFTGDTVNLGNSSTGTFDSKNVGNGKPVTTAMTISGADAGNYLLQQPTGLTANITQLGITVTATGTNRQYDGTVNDAVVLSSAGVVPGDSINFADTSATFANPNVADNKPVSVLGITSSGTDSGNYLLQNTTASTTANVTPRILNLIGTRVYDANTDANASLFGTNGQLTGVNGETLTLSGIGVLTSKNVTPSPEPFANFGSLALAGNGTTLASNYTLTGGTDHVTITPAQLTVTGTQTTNRAYDGTRSDTLSGSVLQGTLGTDTVLLANDTTGLFDTKNVGTNKPVTTAMTVTGVDAANYTVVQPANLSADITALAITVVARGINKVYDGNSRDAVTLSSPGVVTGDVVNFANTSATFLDPNVHTAKPVSVLGITDSGADAGNYTLNNSTASTAADITPVILDLIGTRVYDGTAQANASLFGTAGQLAGVNGETLTLAGIGVLNSKNVNPSPEPFAGFGTLALTGNGTALSSNYTLVGGVDHVTITPAPLTVVGTLATNRIYNGLTTDTLSGSTFSGRFGSDNITLGNATVGQFSSKNVGDNKPITTSMTVGGSDASNYVFTQPTGLTANVTPLGITVSATGSNKIYDGLLSDVVTLSSTGVITGDVLGFTDTAANFSDPNVGLGKTVTVDGIAGSGADARNYTVLNPSATTTANITPVILNLIGSRVYDGATDANASLFGTNGQLAGVHGETLTLAGSGVLNSKNVNPAQGFASLAGFTLTGNGSSLAGNYTFVGGTDKVAISPLGIVVSATGTDKTYDGSINDPVTLAGAGVFTGDNVTFASTSANFADPNADTNKVVTVQGISGRGTDASNYTLLNTSATTTANIAPVILDLIGARTYDGSTNAAAGLFGSNGQLTGINSETLTLAGTGVLNSKNVNPAQGFASLTGFSLTGNGSSLAANYTFVGGTDKVAISPLGIVVSATGTDKTYDGSINDPVTLGSTGVIAGDAVNFASTSATLNDPNVGSGKPVTVHGISNSGADAGNYVLLNTTTSTLANVTPAILNLTGSRVYDATSGADASLFGHNGQLNGINGEVLTLTGSGLLNSKNVNPAQSFASLAGFTLAGNGGSLASNYTFVGGVAEVAITPAMLTASGTMTSNRLYDGTTSDALTGAQLAGLFAGDVVDLGNDRVGTFNTKNSGINKPVSTAMTISGDDAGNYIFIQPAGLMADIAALPITVNAKGNSKPYDGTTNATATLSSPGAIAGDSLAFSASTTQFNDPDIGIAKPIAVSGISISGKDANDYSLINTSATTTGNIFQNRLILTTAAAEEGFHSAIAQTLLLLRGNAIATPYGVAPMNTVGSFSGNHKLQRAPIERNVERSDFQSGLSLNVVDGGVRMPTGAPL